MSVVVWPLTVHEAKALGAETKERGSAFLAVTVKVYPTPFVSPVTVQVVAGGGEPIAEEAAVEQDAPPGDAVTL